MNSLSVFYYYEHKNSVTRAKIHFCLGQAAKSLSFPFELLYLSDRKLELQIDQLKNCGVFSNGSKIYFFIVLNFLVLSLKSAPSHDLFAQL